LYLQILIYSLLLLIKINM